MQRVDHSTCAILVMVLAAAQPSFAQEPAPAARQPASAEMQQMIKRMAPGEGHKIFARMAGKWRGTLRVWNSAQPDAQPMESATESESRLVLGGRFVVEEATGTVMRMPMHRMSVLGYDNLTQQYTLTFYSSLETATNSASGVANAENNAITLRGEFDEPQGKVPFRNVIRFEDDDTQRFESYRLMQDGRELKLIEQVMTRVK
jgi:hypothetical protein